MHTPIVDLVLWSTFLFSTSFGALLFELPFRPKSPFGKPKPCLLDARQLRRVLAIYSLRPHDLGPAVAHELSKIVRTPSYTPTMEEMAELAMRSYVKELKRYKFGRVTVEENRVVARYARRKPKLPLWLRTEALVVKKGLNGK